MHQTPPALSLTTRGWSRARSVATCQLIPAVAGLHNRQGGPGNMLAVLLAAALEAAIEPDK